MVARGHHCHGLWRLYEVLGASRSAPLVARKPVVATVVLHVGGWIGELVAMHLLLVARVIVPPSLLLLLGSSDLVVALLAVESGIVWLLEHLVISPVLLVTMVTLVVHLHGGRVVAWQQLKLGHDAYVVAREMGMRTSGYAVVMEPLLVQPAENTQAFELGVRIEDIVDNTLELICDVGVFQFFHFLLITRFEFKWMGNNLTVYIFLVLVIWMQ